MLHGRLATIIQIGAFAHYVVEIAPRGRILVVEHDRSERRPIPGALVRTSFHARDCILIPAQGDAVTTAAR